MTKYVLAAIQHHGNEKGPPPRGNGLMDAQSLRAFEDQISPLLTSNSLVLVEGNYHKGLLRPGHSLYEAVRREFPISCNAPFTLGMFDSRYNRPATRIKRGNELHGQWMAYVSDSLAHMISRFPRTYEELMEMVQAEPQFVFTKDIQPQDRELARWIQGSDGKFNREYIVAMEHYGPRYDSCILISGAVHSVSIALKTGHPITFLLEDNPETVAAVYDDYVKSMLLPLYMLRKEVVP